MDELIICVAPCPGERQKEKFPRAMDVPAEVIRSYEAGACIAHLHVRDENGLQTTQAEFFRNHVNAIRRACPVIIEGSTGGTPEHTLPERCASFEVAGIELGTLNLGSINMYDAVYSNSIDEIHYYVGELRRRNIKPLMTAFDLSHLRRIDRLTEEKLIAPPYALSLVFDVPSTLPYEDRYLTFMLQELPSGTVWFLTRYHAQGARAFAKALELGGHVRIGFEDGPFLSNGRRAASNAELVAEVVAAAKAVGREVVAPDRAREILGIQSIRIA